MRQAYETQTFSKRNQNILKTLTGDEVKLVERFNEYVLVSDVIKRFRLLKVRMKIGYSAFLQRQTISELLFKTILNVYNDRKLKGLIALPYPLGSDQKAILMYIRGEQSIGAVVECSAKKVRNRESNVNCSDEEDGKGSDHSILPEYI